MSRPRRSSSVLSPTSPTGATAIKVPSTSLIQPLAHALDAISQHKFTSADSEVSPPLPYRKRAAVALVIRIHPSPDHPPPNIGYLPTSLDEFFSRRWVQHGTPEVLFIKRAVRKGDRWNGHIAFPGGRWEEGDEWSKGTAMRETMEEVGLDLSGPDCLYVGECKERIVRTLWGDTPLMILGMQVFILTSPVPPVLTLNPTEVASTHWAPFTVLLDPAAQTVLRCDVADRLRFPCGKIVRSALRCTIGEMEFPAIRLQWGERSVRSAGSPNEKGELVLWGLTLGMVFDTIAQLPYIGRPAIERVFEFPTVTAWDLRLWVDFMTRDTRRKRKESLRSGKDGDVSVTMLYWKDYNKELRRAVMLGLTVRFGFIAAATGTTAWYIKNWATASK